VSLFNLEYIITMRKPILFMVAIAIAASFSACKKDEDNSGGGTTPQITCKLKSTKETITTVGSPTSYSGFVLYYDNNDIINRANFIDSTTGKEDSTSYALLSYSSGNITGIKIFQKGTTFINFAMTYSAQNRIMRRSFDLPPQFGDGEISQTYFYDNQGRLSYTVRRTEFTITGFGKIISTDSALYQNYTTLGRPGGVIVYNSVTNSSGTTPYGLSEEIKYEYDANGNRTKISTRDNVNDPFEVTDEATFDMAKTPGEGEEAYRLLTKLFIDDWDDPNIDAKDIDKNLIISATEYDNGNGKTETTKYTFDNRGNPATSTTNATGEIGNTTFTYLCK